MGIDLSVSVSKSDKKALFLSWKQDPSISYSRIAFCIVPAEAGETELNAFEDWLNGPRQTENSIRRLFTTTAFGLGRCEFISNALFGQRILVFAKGQSRNSWVETGDGPLECVFGQHAVSCVFTELAKRADYISYALRVSVESICPRVPAGTLAYCMHEGAIPIPIPEITNGEYEVDLIVAPVVGKRSVNPRVVLVGGAVPLADPVNTVRKSN